MERIKNYINKQVAKIQLFPELVSAYNNNKFFNDLPSIVSTNISIDTEEEFEFLEYLFNKRKRFLQKNGIKDICKYSDWPEIITTPTINTIENSIDSECPF